MKHILAATLTLLTPILLAQTQPTPQPESNPELKALFQEDQRVRTGPPLTPEERARITRTDSDRITEVHQIVAANQIHTAQDYRNASLILQHSLISDDYLLAHTLAVLGAAKGDKVCLWLSAATLDRYLQSINQPQIYGTQFKFPTPTNPTQMTQQPYTTTLITDPLRKELGVPSIDDQKKQVETVNNKSQSQSH